MTVVVDGFGKVKKCTDEGRMLMSVDFSSLIRNLERVTRVSPIPNSKYVEEFIGCFFTPENSLLDWVQVHPEYPPKLMLSMMSLMTVKYDMKRSVKKAFIEEVEKILRANGHTVEEHSSLSLFGMLRLFWLRSMLRFLFFSIFCDATCALFQAFKTRASFPSTNWRFCAFALSLCIRRSNSTWLFQSVCLPYSRFRDAYVCFVD
jgi:hypothetical protein